MLKNSQRGRRAPIMLVSDSGVIRMSMGDERFFYWPPRVNVKVSRAAIKAIFIHNHEIHPFDIELEFKIEKI